MGRLGKVRGKPTFPQSLESICIPPDPSSTVGRLYQILAAHLRDLNYIIYIDPIDHAHAAAQLGRFPAQKRCSHVGD